MVLKWERLTPLEARVEGVVAMHRCARGPPHQNISDITNSCFVSAWGILKFLPTLHRSIDLWSEGRMPEGPETTLYMKRRSAHCHMTSSDA